MSNKKEIFKELQTILAEITGLEVEEIHMESSLMADLGIESFDIADLNFKVKEVFGITHDLDFLSLEGIVGNSDFVDENNYLTLAGLQEMKQRIPSLRVTEEMKENRIPLMTLMEKVSVKDLGEFVVSRLN